MTPYNYILPFQEDNAEEILNIEKQIRKKKEEDFEREVAKIPQMSNRQLLEEIYKMLLKQKFNI